jgi:hypothetical protein
MKLDQLYEASSLAGKSPKNGKIIGKYGGFQKKTW